MGLISRGVRYEVMVRDGLACRYCGRRPPEVVLEVDHVMPKSRGGTNARENLVTACFDCNRGKSDKLPAVPMVETVVVETASTDTHPSPPVAWWFHSWEPIEDESIARYSATKLFGGERYQRAWQGQILAEVGLLFQVQLYSWMDGCPTEARLVERAEAAHWTLYESNDVMRMADGCDEIHHEPRELGWRCGSPKAGYVESAGWGRTYACASCLQHYSGKKIYLR